MPIIPSISVRDLTQAEFDERDFVVMRCAYDAQNATGRLCDERVYENDVARRLRAKGMPGVHTQMLVTVIHGTFAKEYFIDLIASDAVYEVKAATALAPSHDGRALHYAMLLDVRHVKLLNFRTGRVQGRLHYNALSDTKRKRWVADIESWRPASSACSNLYQCCCDLLNDWGAFLETSLYEEALVHFCASGGNFQRRVPVIQDGVELGSHPFLFHSDEVPFVVTAFNKDICGQRSHLERLMKMTSIRRLQWINFDRHVAQFVTLGPF